MADRKVKKICIAIDGPAGSGKSTTARMVAERLGYLHLDTGAMYRAVTLHALQQHIDLLDNDKLVTVTQNSQIHFENNGSTQRVFLNGADVTEAIRTPQVTNSIGPVAANPQVRAILVEKQQEVMRHGGVVAEGRDIGTVVCPQAELKIFMMASIAERARRRYKEMQEKGIKVDMQTLIKDMEQRDSQDTDRKVNPLKKAGDAILLDNSQMSVAEQVDFVIHKVQEILAADAGNN